MEPASLVAKVKTFLSSENNGLSWIFSLRDGGIWHTFSEKNVDRYANEFDVTHHEIQVIAQGISMLKSAIANNDTDAMQRIAGTTRKSDATKQLQALKNLFIQVFKAEVATGKRHHERAKELKLRRTLGAEISDIEIELSERFAAEEAASAKNVQKLLGYF